MGGILWQAFTGGSRVRFCGEAGLTKTPGDAGGCQAMPPDGWDLGGGHGWQGQGKDAGYSLTHGHLRGSGARRWWSLHPSLSLSGLFRTLLCARKLAPVGFIKTENGITNVIFF